MAQLLTHQARAANLLLLVAVLALPACTGKPWERDFWHPPAASGVEPIKSGPQYPITRAAGGQQTWPNLGDVPAKEDPPLDQKAEQAALEALKADQASAAAADAAVRAAPVGAASATSGNIALPSTSPTIPPEVGE